MSCRTQAKSTAVSIGSSVIRLPVAAAMALVSAGAEGGLPGSPTPEDGAASTTSAT